MTIFLRLSEAQNQWRMLLFISLVLILIKLKLSRFRFFDQEVPYDTVNNSCFLPLQVSSFGYNLCGLGRAGMSICTWFGSAVCMILNGSLRDSLFDLFFVC